MKRFLIILLLPLVALGLCSFGKEKRAKKDQLVRLHNSIERVIHHVDPNVHIGIEVVSLATGEKLYQKNAHQLFVPASGIKIFTGAAALALLGIDYRFETQLLSDVKLKGSILDGNIYLKGSGDPELSFKDLDDLIFQLKLLDVNEIKGDLLLDNFDFDNVAQGPGWMWDEGAEAWNSPMDALTVDHSCVKVWVKPGKAIAKPLQLVVYPKLACVGCENYAVTSEDRSNLKVERRWLTKENVIEVTGSLKIDSPIQEYEIPLESPPLFAAELVKILFKKYKIAFKGGVYFKEAPVKTEVLATHISAPLNMIVQNMMKSSDNLSADCLFKKLGQVRFEKPGTWAKGSQAMREFLQNRAEIDVREMVLLDGCGGSRYNLVTPHQFTQFLSWMQGQFSYFPEFMASLPLGGVDGTLKMRMAGNMPQGKVRAKTGTMTGISSLCGYATTKDGEMLAFSILINGFVGAGKEYKMRLEDEICRILNEFSRDQKN